MESFERTCGRPLIFRGVMGGKSHDELVAHAKSVGKDFQREKATEQYACLVSEVMDYCAVLIAEGDPFISLTDGGGILSEFSAARRKNSNNRTRSRMSMKFVCAVDRGRMPFKGMKISVIRVLATSGFFPPVFAE